MFVIKTYLAPDQYGGTGVFAGESIKKDQVVYRYNDETSRIMTVEEYKAICAADEKLAKTLKTYCYPGEQEIDGVLTRVLFHDLGNSSFTNHSDDPNTWFVDDPSHPGYATNDGINLAKRDIAEGEELTTDYFSFIDDLDAWSDVETCMQFLIDMGHPRTLKFKKAS
ncbi:MAG: hypothetical protein DI551_07730 [Micavibrio aeruginosavorus]|uniref:SET domain-containing protein n=1 Tax=Micavibrio aeruginosavorus TaxID=349221 RepID=A0A2W5MVT6_9BACT|nr:MAG: hypothetical protein DI551_07730 [Micavibrio aeruginosavorus]